jgi:transposase
VRLRRRSHLVRLRTSSVNRSFGLLTQWGGQSPDALASAWRAAPVYAAAAAMPDLLDRISKELNARMRELRPVVREFERL